MLARSPSSPQTLLVAALFWHDTYITQRVPPSPLQPCADGRRTRQSHESPLEAKARAAPARWQSRRDDAHAQALALVDRAIALNQRDPFARLIKGCVPAQLWRAADGAAWDKQRACLAHRAILKLPPSPPLLHSVILKFNPTRLSLAIPCLRTANVHDPYLFASYQVLSVALSARPQRCAHLSPQRLADCYLQARNFKMAMAVANSVLERMRTNPKVRYTQRSGRAQRSCGTAGYGAGGLRVPRLQEQRDGTPAR
jgi:hypothetical protein